MCGRYYIEIDEKELREIVNAVEKGLISDNEQMTFIKTSGEIFPTDIVPVQTGINKYQPMKWGFSGHGGKPVINARSETAAQKPMFSEAMRERRCVIPASGYYEWKTEGKKKTKYQFHIPGKSLYFAGCYRREPHKPFYSFCILTRQAAWGAEAIHPRMPVIIPQKHIETWLNEMPSEINYAVPDLEFEAVITSQQLSLFGEAEDEK